MTLVWEKPNKNLYERHMWRLARKSDHGTHKPESDAGDTCVFCGENSRRRRKMPRNKFQRMIFALLTVIITVYGYVFYSVCVI